jgi:histidine triad (HIT) family protein
MSDCPICDLAAGSIPSWVVYRNAQVFAFLPREIEAYGHTVIAPIHHVADIYAASPEVLGKLISVAQMLAEHYRRSIGAAGVNLLHASGTAAQQSVAHLHFHLIPRFDDDGLNAWPALPGTMVGKDDLLARLKM